MMESRENIKLAEIPRRDVETDERKGLGERFDELLKGRISEMPNGNFKTGLLGIDSLTITRQGENSLSIVLFYEDHRRHITFSLFGDGVLSGRVPKELHVNHDQILDEVLRIVDSVEIESWYQVPDEILPPGFWPKVGNAAYFIDFDEPLTGERAKAPPRGTRVSKEESALIHHERGEILNRYWRLVGNISKHEARKRGLNYFVHRGDDWQEAMNEEFSIRRRQGG